MSFDENMQRRALGRPNPDDCTEASPRSPSLVGDDVDQSLSQLFLEVSGLCLEAMRSGAGCFLQARPQNLQWPCLQNMRGLTSMGTCLAGEKPRVRGGKSVFCDSRTSTRAAALQSCRRTGPFASPKLSPSLLLSSLPR